MSDALPVFIAADDPAIRYEGRIDFSNPKAPEFAYPGVEIVFRFEAEELELELGDSGDSNYFGLSLDGAEPVVLRSAAGLKRHAIAPRLGERLSAGPHELRLYKRTESMCGIESFRGIYLAAGGRMLPPPPRATRSIEFIGDSITCGYGNLASTYDPAPEQFRFHAENEDNGLAWGSLAAKALGARAVTVAYSGRGIYRNCDETEAGTLPEIIHRIFPDDATRGAWDFSRYVPDLVVVNLGTNDYNSLETKKDLSRDEFDSRLRARYRGMLCELRAAYGERIRFLCCVGSMLGDGFPVGEEALTRARQNVSLVVEELVADGFAIRYLDLEPQEPPFGEDWHPTAATHRAMAEQLRAAVRDFMVW
jgi:Lysophospholipase L1 and related esterases